MCNECGNIIHGVLGDYLVTLSLNDAEDGWRVSTRACPNILASSLLILAEWPEHASNLLGARLPLTYPTSYPGSACLVVDRTVYYVEPDGCILDFDRWPDAHAAIAAVRRAYDRIGVPNIVWD